MLIGPCGFKVKGPELIQPFDCSRITFMKFNLAAERSEQFRPCKPHSDPSPPSPVLHSVGRAAVFSESPVAYPAAAAAFCAVVMAAVMAAVTAPAAKSLSLRPAGAGGTRQNARLAAGSRRPVTPGPETPAGPDLRSASCWAACAPGKMGGAQPGGPARGCPPAFTADRRLRVTGPPGSSPVLAGERLLDLM